MSLIGLTGNPRHDQLLILIAERGHMNIDELANLLDVSMQAVHRGVHKSGEQGLITRRHGGASRASGVVNMAFEQCEVSRTEERGAITEAVADYISDGLTIFITTGTIIKYIARALPNHSRLRMIIDSLRVAHISYHNSRFEVIVPGDTLHSHDSGIIGLSAVSFVADFRADYLVTSVGAIENNGALMKFDVNGASVVKTMMAYARNILLVADRTKYYTSAVAETDNVAQVTALFTGELPSAVLESRLQDSQIKIILPQKGA